LEISIPRTLARRMSCGSGDVHATRTTTVRNPKSGTSFADTRHVRV
jgi:hypothetical protein